ncbi:enoyl-CoA hydratase/isomerase family protein [Streptomyces sp. UG1]|uniref:enoyl-CoA hydratase/isomerase family protein n=1 Tax=Streptomyces sp. UG1 TaxID=3417652 RepID=UPI003CE6D22D
MDALISVERRDAVCWVRLRAPRSNALTRAFARELADAVREAGRDESCACIAITSAHRNFCTGADTSLLAEVGHDPLEEDSYAALGEIYDLFCTLQRSPLPTVAGVGGKVLGAGINLALACDVRIAADDLDVRGFAVAGVHPGGGHLRMLDRELAPGWAAAVGLFGQTIDASTAVASGFALSAVPREELDGAVAEIAAAAGSDAALVRKVTASHRAVRGADLTPEAAVLLERPSQLWSLRRRKG